MSLSFYKDIFYPKGYSSKSPHVKTHISTQKDEQISRNEIHIKYKNMIKLSF